MPRQRPCPSGSWSPQTSDLLASYTDDQLQVIDDFLTRVRQLTAHADTLGTGGQGA